MSQHGVVEPTQVGKETERHERDRRLDEIYERFGRPLEADHWGEYLAVSPAGETLLGTDLTDVVERAVDTFGLGKRIPLFKIGQIAVERWR